MAEPYLPSHCPEGKGDGCSDSTISAYLAWRRAMGNCLLAWEFYVSTEPAAPALLAACAEMEVRMRGAVEDYFHEALGDDTASEIERGALARAGVRQ